jgi:Ca2+-dependent lipid-binding protein
MTTQTLARSQQLMLQRLMARHILEDTEAKQIFAGVQKVLTQDDDHSQMTLEKCFAEVNQQLTKGFGLEIATVVLNQTKYHAVINSHADEVSKRSFEQHFDAHDRQFIQQVLAHLVESDTGSGIPRKDLYNLRSDLKDPYKMTLQGAEHVVETLLQENWLRNSLDQPENRRESMQATLELAPRTYLELSHLLVELGIQQDQLPQFLFHRL